MTLRENARKGTDAWRIRTANIPSNHEIEGYASATSVARGGSISFFVNTSSPEFTIEFFRMGWYGGAGARSMNIVLRRAGVSQPPPSVETRTGLIECAWTAPVVLEIPAASDPTEWMSGIYLAKLTALDSAKQSWIHFVVRDDARRAGLFFQSSVTTYQAYNNWGGRSLYGSNSAGGQATEVSFDRPYSGYGDGQFIWGWEFNMVRFLEREGYDVVYGTNIDTHARPELLENVDAFLSVGHDEYWSRAMRTNVEAARDRGVHLGFFSANTCFWQVRLEPSAGGAADRRMIAYKETAAVLDPFSTDDNQANDRLVTTRWRTPPVSEPEEELIGTMYTAAGVDGDLVVDAPDHWVFRATGLQKGTILPGLLGYEVDRMQGFAPPGTVRLMHSPFDDDGERSYSDMTVYETPGGAVVFATGTIQWSWGLDDWNFDAPPASLYSRQKRTSTTAPPLTFAEAAGRPSRVSRAAQQITRNVLARFARESGRARAVRR